MMSVPSEIKERSLAVCKDYLNGAWAALSLEEFNIKTVNGGLTNHIYLCELPARYEMQRRENEPKKVLLRFYGAGAKSMGEGDTSPTLSNLTENLLCAILAERKLGPKLYGVFNGGRIEEYISARSLTREELADPDISFKIAEKLGKIHALKSLPFNKEPDKIFDTMMKWLVSFSTRLGAPKGLDLSPDPLIGNGKVEWKKINLQKEIDFCKSLAHNTKSPIVFCHGDLQEGNILIRQRIPPHNQSQNYPTDRIYTNSNIKLDFIDYEYSTYTYRAFDLANHFCEWAFDYSDKTHPFFSVHPDDFPDNEQQLTFIRAYLRSFKECSSSGHHSSSCYKEAKYCSFAEPSKTRGLPDQINSPKQRYNLRSNRNANCPIETLQSNLISLSLEEEQDQVFLLSKPSGLNSGPPGPVIADSQEVWDKETEPGEETIVLKEIQAFVPIVHLFWLLWSLVQSEHSTIAFGYEEHAQARYQAYNAKKAELKRLGKTLFGN